MSNSFCLHTKFELPAGCKPVALETDQGITVEVRSICLGEAMQACAEIAETINASEHPVPAGQLAAQKAVRCAEYAGRPMSCELSLEMI